MSRTHTQLWLQGDAAKDVGIEYRLEVLFPSVQYLCTPFMLWGIFLRKATADERARLIERHELEIDPQWGFYLLSRSHDWFVVSGTPSWAEADLKYNDESVFWSSRHPEGAVKSIGTLE